MAATYRCTVPDVLREQGRSVAWFCRKVGICRALYYRWLDGSRPILPVHRARAAAVLGLPERFLFVPIASLESDKVAPESEAVAV